MIFTPLMYLRVATGVIVAAILAWGLLTIRHWRQDSLRVAAVEAQAKKDVADARLEVAALQAAYKASQDATRGYVNELQAIRRAPAPAPTVRLCRPAANLPKAAGSAAGTPATPGAAGVVRGDDAGDPGPDVGPDLIELSRKADECSAQLRALQGWVQAVTAPPH